MTLTKIKTGGIQDDAVTSAKIPADAVGSSELADNSVANSNIINSAVSTAKIADDAVTTAKLATDAVTNAKLADQAVTLDKLPHGTSSNDGKFLRANNGADPSFETVSIPAGTTINNNADNRIITGSGTANTLNAESAVLIDNSGRIQQGSDTSNLGAAKINIVTGGEDGISIGKQQGAGVSSGDVLGTLAFQSAIGSQTTNSAEASIKGIAAENSSGSTAATNLAFFTKPTGTGPGSSPTERMRIDSNGNLGIGTTSPINNSGYGGLSLNGSSGSLLSLLQNGTEGLRIFGDSNPALQHAGSLRLFSGVSGGTNTWSITPSGTTTGQNSVTFNLKSNIQHTAGVASMSSTYNGGDLYVRIDNIYNLSGNAWWTFSGLLISSQVVGTLAGHHSTVCLFTLTGLGSWSGVSINNIVGSTSCSVSQHGSNFVELQFDFNNSSRGANTVICNGGTFDPPRISFH